MLDVMIDLETLSNRPNAAIIALGAAVVGDKEKTFYETISWDSAASIGHVDMGTVKWWMKQSEAARKDVTEEGRGIAIVLLDFASWLRSFKYETTRVWGYGAAFDNAVLSNAYKELGLSIPWSYKNDMCYRTLSTLYPEVEFEQKGTYHNALDDALSQAAHLESILEVHHGRKESETQVKQT